MAATTLTMASALNPANTRTDQQLETPLYDSSSDSLSASEGYKTDEMMQDITLDPGNGEKGDELEKAQTINTNADHDSPDTLDRTVSRTPSATQMPTFSPVQEAAFIAMLCMAQLLMQAGLAQSIAPLHVIGDSFNTDNPGQLSWLPAAYSLTVGTFILPAGRWGDLFGHRRLFVAGFLFFALWSLIAGFSVWSDSLVFFAFCRGMQGVGAAMLLPNALAILGRTYPPGRKKNMVFALFGATAPAGYVLGATFSGIFAQLVWWPWGYWVGGMVLVLCAAMVFMTVPPMPVFGSKPKLEELDLVGTVLGVTGLILFNFAWNEGPAAGWGQVYVYVLLIVGCILLGAFMWYELRFATYPLLPASVFSRDNNLVLGCIAVGWGSFGIWLYYYWQLSEVLRGDSMLLTTAQMAPVAILGACAAIVTGRLLGTIGPGWVMMIAMVAFCVGNILLGTVPVAQTYWAQTFVAMVVTPFGMDMSFPAGSIILSNHMPPQHQGMAASILCVIQNYAVSIGLGMGGTVETQVSGGSLLAGYRGAWYLAIGLDGLGILLALWLVFSWRAGTKARAKSQAEEKAAASEP